jgi:hypothetical protein
LDDAVLGGRSELLASAEARAAAAFRKNSIPGSGRDSGENDDDDAEEAVSVGRSKTGERRRVGLAARVAGSTSATKSAGSAGVGPSLPAGEEEAKTESRRGGAAITEVGAELGRRRFTINERKRFSSTVSFLSTWGSIDPESQ